MGNFLLIILEKFILLKAYAFNWGVDLTLNDDYSNSSFTSLPEIGAVIVNYLLVLGVILAVIALVYSGIKYITAGENQDEAVKAKNNISWAITGIVLIALALVIVRWVSEVFNSASTTSTSPITVPAIAPDPSSSTVVPGSPASGGTAPNPDSSTVAPTP